MQVNLDPGTEQFLDRLSKMTRRMEKAQQEISSGKRFTSVSDEPDEVANLLQTRANLEGTQQIGRNLSRVKTEADTAEQALATAQQLLDSARSIAAQGATSFTTQEQRSILSEQVKALMERMTTIANTEVEGRYVFSGDADASPAFVLDFATQTPPYGTYLGRPATRQVLTADGSTFNAGFSADSLFDAPGSSVFAALEQLRAALATGTVTDVTTAAQSVGTAADHLNARHAAYGDIQSHVNNAIDLAAKHELQLKGQLGSLEDADIAASAVEFQNAQLSRNVALQAHAQMPRKSLFDYLG